MDRIVLTQFQERARSLAAPGPSGPAEGGLRAPGYD
jgi:hypothetical protein